MTNISLLTKEFSEMGTTKQMCLVSAKVNGSTPFFIERLKTTIENNNLAYMFGMPLELSTALFQMKKWLLNK